VNRRCPECAKVGRDADGDHMFLMESGDRWCCNKPYHASGEPYYEKEGDSIEENEEPVEDILAMLIDSESPSFPKVEVGEESMVSKVLKEHRVDQELQDDYRGIPPHIYKQYGVYGSYDKSDLKRLSHPIYEVGGDELCIKYRELPKDFKTYGTSTKGKKVELFGQRTARSSRTLVITEGEIDAMSLEYAIGMTKYAKPAVVSLPFGANVKAIADNENFIKKYDKLIICPDGDEAGAKFAKEMASLYPTALFMDLGEHKDLNEMLEEGRFSEITTAFFGASQYKPPSLANITKLSHLISVPIKMGLTTPWPSIDDITYGLMEHTIISIGAGPSIGKTEYVRALQQHIMDVHGEKIAIFSLEESPEATLRQLTGYIMGERIHLPNAVYDPKKAQAIAQGLDGKAMIYDSSYFNRKWENIEQACRQFVSLGARVIFIDPVSALVTGSNSSDANTALGVIMDDMTNLVKELPVTIVMVNHLNNPKTGVGHEEGAWPKPGEFTGSKAQWRFSHFMIGLQRDTLNQDEDIKNTLGVQNIKCRINGGLQGKRKFLVYDQITGNFIEQSVKF